ncbi:hypothetical protein COI63_29330 [Bacillus toyonensis]|uniref:hypothetical protein n=1 Tax=Bacillus toyonensis TaxID=155322 RepID=UPI000BFDD9D0|nr:hypothetical protein [Bacillus toyonensis]PHF98340.1 hypothetical protein COI63_29330 [Bacillus toyonensis]
MKKNIGFLTFNRSKGKLYVYLMKAFRENEKKKNITLYKFGRLDIALENMYDWNDLHNWILSIETGNSKCGRKLIVSEIDIYQMNTGSFV